MKLGKRHGWLDALPPFAMGYAPGPGTTAEALGTLRQLQAYLCEYLASDNVSAVFEMVRVLANGTSAYHAQCGCLNYCVCACVRALYHAAIYNHC